MVKTNKRFKIWVLVLVFVISGVSYISANAAELSNPEQQKLQEKFARNLEALEQDVKNPNLIPLQPTQDWQELMGLLKKQRQAKKDKEAGKTPNNLTDEEKQKIENLQKKEREAMGEFVSVGTGPNSSEWEKLEETTEEINKLTLVVIERIIEAYALATGKTPKEIKDNVWVKHPTKDKYIFNKAYFEKLAKETNGKDKNFARLLQTGGIVDELFKRYEMFFRMTDWKAVNEDFKNISLGDQGILAKLARDSNRNQATLFNKKWDELRFDSIGSQNSDKLVMNYRMTNLTDIRDLFANILFKELGVPNTVLKNAKTQGKSYAEFVDEKYNYKVK